MMMTNLSSSTFRSLRRSWKLIGQTTATSTTTTSRANVMGVRKIPSTPLQWNGSRRHYSQKKSSVVHSTSELKRVKGRTRNYEGASISSNIAATTKEKAGTETYSALPLQGCDYGPLGRPVLTEALLKQQLSSFENRETTTTTTTLNSSLSKLEELVKLSSDNQAPLLVFQSKSPKLVWNQARDRFGFEPPQYRLEVVGNSSIPDENLYKVTVLTVFPNPAANINTSASIRHNYYEALCTHDHVGSHPDYDWIEMVAVGIGTTKQKAGQLAALDQIQLWKEATGIDLTLPPESRPSIAFSDRDTVNRYNSKNKDTNNHDANTTNNTINGTRHGNQNQGDDFALDVLYSKSQTLLGLLRCSPVRYDFDHHQKMSGTKIANSYWTADAETYFRGTYYFSTGTDESFNNNNNNGDIVPFFQARSKKEAAKHALIALLEQNKDTLLGKTADSYTFLLKSAPQIAALRIPRWKKGLARDLESSLTSWEQFNSIDDASQNSSSSSSESPNKVVEDAQRNTHAIRRTIEAGASAATSTALWNQEQNKRERYSRDHPNIFRSIEKDRSNLPISTLRQNLKEALQTTSNVVLVQAGTGSGKSTQIPQYLLEDALSSQTASTTRILVTQPRRIAAKSLAERVAYERLEVVPGDNSKSNSNRRDNSNDRSVGYSVRFDSLKPRKEGGTIEFVTTGILLKRLLNGDKGLEGISHVLIDEVHERDLNTDLLLVLMKDLFVRQQLHHQQGIEPQSHTPKLVLLSATLETTALTDYFSPAELEEDVPIPVLSLPTKPLHPVETWYLEDLLGSNNGGKAFSPKLRDLALPLLRSNDHVLQQEVNELKARKRNVVNADRIATLQRALSLGETHRKSFPISSLRGNPEEEKYPDAPLTPNKLKSTMIGLVSELALHLSQIETTKDNANNMNGGSILCFLPGMNEIKECMYRLEEDCPESLRSRLTILPLHSEIPHHEQARVFEPSKSGTIKVILSTNIAESSLTIGDVLAVIDSGLVKESTFDAASSMTTLDTIMASKASSIQRLGRVGRIAPGTCYRLYSRGDFEAMEEKATPEIQKTCLEGTCLQVCSLLEGKTTQGFGSVKDFLAGAIDAPPEDSVEVALDKLTSLGAITVPSTRTNRDEPENITFLGECLVRLPLDPSIGKMLVMGSAMNCLGPLLTAAAWFGENQMVFSHPSPGQREEARESHRSFSETSDIEGIVLAYDSYWQVQAQEGWKAARHWAREHCVNPAAMASMKAVRRQLLNELCRAGLVEQGDVFGGELRKGATVNKQGDCRLLVSALWCTAIPKNLAGRNKMGRFGSLTTASEEIARLHPSSVLFHRKPPRNPKSDGSGDTVVTLPEWYSFIHKVQTSDVFLRGCSSVLPEQILLFGGSHLDTRISCQNHNIRAILDGWIAIESVVLDGEESVDLLIRAREAIKTILEQKLLYVSSKSSQDSTFKQYCNKNDDAIIDGIRRFLDGLETNRVPEPEPRAPSNDFLDYFLMEGEAEA